MSLDLNQNTVDEKIHDFLASKSPRKTFSETIADWLLRLKIHGKPTKGVSYEQIDWHQGR